MYNRTLSLACLCMIAGCFFLIPAVSALVEEYQVIPKSIDPNERDSPENIAALKTHIAYVGSLQEARMNGVITYIRNISGSTGIGKLEDIRDDYLSAAASIPVMQSADEINALRDDMVTQTRLFAEETQTQMVMFNGTSDDLRATADLSMQAFDISAGPAPDTLWLSRENARIKIFSRESAERNSTLQSLSGKGIDISQARQIADQIDAKRADIENALRTKQGDAMARANTGIKTLNQQFRNTVDGYQAGFELQMKTAAIMAMKG